MHGSIRDCLEDLLWADRLNENLLSAEGSAASNRGTLRDQATIEHLSSCNECSSELRAMKTQAELLQALRAPEETEPSGGFYSRVMQRIEERAKDSIWSAFIYSPFAKRLTYASLAATLLLGSYVISEQVRNGTGNDQAVIEAVHDDPVVTGNLEQQRDAVLVNFVSHQGQLP